jgi:hypothetical protein
MGHKRVSWQSRRVRRHDAYRPDTLGVERLQKLRVSRLLRGLLLVLDLLRELVRQSEVRWGWSASRPSAPMNTRDIQAPSPRARAVAENARAAGRIRDTAGARARVTRGVTRATGRTAREMVVSWRRVRRADMFVR